MWMQDINGVAVNLDHCKTIFLTDKEPSGNPTYQRTVVCKGDGFSGIRFMHENEKDAREAYDAIRKRVQVFKVVRDGAFYKA